MSSFKSELTTKASQEKAVQACRYALKEMQLVIKKDDGAKFIANEKLRMLGFANPAKIEVDIQSANDTLRINVKASNIGLGPIQGGHVKGVADTFLSQVQLKLSESTKGESPKSVADEIAKLAALKEQGLLSEEEYSMAKARLLRDDLGLGLTYAPMIRAKQAQRNDDGTAMPW